MTGARQVTHYIGTQFGLVRKMFQVKHMIERKQLWSVKARGLGEVEREARRDREERDGGEKYEGKR